MLVKGVTDCKLRRFTEKLLSMSFQNVVSQAQYISKKYGVAIRAFLIM